MFQSKLNKVALRRRDTLEAYRSPCHTRCIKIAGDYCSYFGTTEYSFYSKEFNAASDIIGS